MLLISCKDWLLFRASFKNSSVGGRVEGREGLSKKRDLTRRWTSTSRNVLYFSTSGAWFPAFSDNWLKMQNFFLFLKLLARKVLRFCRWLREQRRRTLRKSNVARTATIRTHSLLTYTLHTITSNEPVDNCCQLDHPELSVYSWFYHLSPDNRHTLYS